MKLIFLHIASLVFGLTIAAPSYAGSASAALSVNATFIPTCDIGGGALNFGSLSGNNVRGNIDQYATFSVTCTYNAPYSISMEMGGSPNAQKRRLANGSDYLDYELYYNTCGTTLWGNGIVGGNALGGLIGTGMAQSYTVCARITGVHGRPAGDYRFVAEGSYQDIVNITVNF